ncbi:hypothetical protein HBI26_144490 [Parastagonospora nodorum]|nr:hypothetical protein HBH50_224540 [Parastagonospora nodorum]KAH4421361.1 hypothetical protein HBH93_202380 [Parastagonospora nodorum]KAH4499944.1 hypothetical protein HBH89_122170 [Parastagonospora nodorum]KAH4533647.1 hypothetical protein HBH86_203040 [Parastagonospora nodorum]KAH4865028.1 hypothetical protein HBH58_189150 [Parastagonospora nodorum]
MSSFLVMVDAVHCVQLAHEYEHYRDREDGEGDDGREANSYCDSGRSIIFGKDDFWHVCVGTLARGRFGEVVAENGVRRRCGLNSMKVWGSLRVGEDAISATESMWISRGIEGELSVHQ